MQNETVTASEIGKYAFCEEALRLRVIGAPSANQPQLTAGIAEHTDKATAERIAGDSIAIGRILIIASILALLAAFLWR